MTVEGAEAVARPVLVAPDARTGPLRIHPGPRLFRGVENGPGVAAHRRVFGPLPRLDLGQLLALVAPADIRGRGGAGFPFARKLQATAEASGRPTVVVNLSEGEPASFKDVSLALTAPHLVLDGAAVAAHALRARTVHVVLPGEHEHVRATVQRALDEREPEHSRIRWRTHVADARFVAGQARAVIELMSGRPNLPVTAWQPEAVSGHRGRPTLLSNAETYAQVAALVLDGWEAFGSLGISDEPGTRLLTVDGEGLVPEVREVAHGTPWHEILPTEVLARPVLLGGYHGTWAREWALQELTVSRTALAEHGLAIGAGIVLPLAAGDCPLHRTARIATYLASQSARRCGPCLNGLPALAEAVWGVQRGRRGTDRAERLGAIVEGRGACAHPDGTVRLVRSMLAAFPEEIEAHRSGHCTFAGRALSEEPERRPVWLSGMLP